MCKVVFGREVAGRQVNVPGYRAAVVNGRMFPAMVPDNDAVLSGLVFDGLTDADLKAADYYLDSNLFVRRPLSLNGSQEIGKFQTHFPTKGVSVGPKDWSRGSQSNEERQNIVEAARQIMRGYAVQNQFNDPLNHHGIDMRARSIARADGLSVPVGRRRGFALQDVNATRREQPYARYFAVEEFTVTHPKFDGGQSDPLERSVFLAADAVIVLPYDPKLDLVLLVEQFRPGPFARSDRTPWMLEPVAGRCDGSEDLPEVARRELMEEAGLEAQHLEFIAGFYPSPGCLSEYKHVYLAIVTLAGREAGTYGLEAEGEDILTHILPWEEAEALLQSGEADNSAILVSLLWLQANRSRLRNEWAGA